MSHTASGTVKELYMQTKKNFSRHLKKNAIFELFWENLTHHILHGGATEENL